MFDAIATPALNLTAAEVRALPREAYVSHVVASVVEWHKVFEQTPSLELQAKLIQEEMHELANAGIDLGENETTVERVAAFLKEHADVAFTTAGLQVVSKSLPQTETPTEAEFFQLIEFMIAMESVGQAAAVATLAVNGTIHEEGWDPETFELIAREAFHRVVQSNLSKLGDDGRPVFKEDGKIAKGPNYQAPDLTDLAEALIASKGLNRKRLN